MKPNEYEIERLFYLYSAEEVGKALFALTSCNSNRGALVRHRFLYAVFLKTKEEAYQKKLRILSFEEFTEFSEKLLKITPSFKMLEDYMPEDDWGEIKYWHNEKVYKILYGDELSNPYDYLNSFKVTVAPINEEIVEILNENPEVQIQNLLEVLDWIITNLPRNKIHKNDQENGTIRFFEVPSKEYWNEVCALFIEDISSLISNKIFLDRFTVNPSVT